MSLQNKIFINISIQYYYIVIIVFKLYLYRNRILIYLNPRNDLIPTSFDNMTYFYTEIN